MTYYYETKAEAQKIAEDIRVDQRIGNVLVELEPLNGWVVVIIPKYIDLTEYGDRFEVRTIEGARLTARPKDHKRYTTPKYPMNQKPTVAAVKHYVTQIVPNSQLVVKRPWEK